MYSVLRDASVPHISFITTADNSKNLFDDSAGDVKSSVVKSPPFGAQRSGVSASEAEDHWQCLLYPNSGSTSSSHPPDDSNQNLNFTNTGNQPSGSGAASQNTGSYLALYLACLPVSHELDACPSGNGTDWSRTGLYKFSFESLCWNFVNYLLLKNVVATCGKKKVATKAASEEKAFSSKSTSWGWLTFARRDAVYYDNPAIISDDALLITCTVCACPIFVLDF